jgi:hypothetical protein
MTKLRVQCVAVSIVLAGCGPSANAPPVSPPIAAKPDVIVTIDGAHRSCVVALYREAQGNSISCDDIIPFMRDELRISSGSIYDLRANPGVDAAERAKVQAALQGAGYRFIGGPPAGHP